MLQDVHLFCADQFGEVSYCFQGTFLRVVALFVSPQILVEQELE